MRIRHSLKHFAEATQTLEDVREISEAGNSLSKIIKAIDDIAFQTNVLALTAVKEAERAGKHGRGFAVIADEMRNIAAQSTKTAKETIASIEGLIEKTNAGYKSAMVTADSLREIVGNAHSHNIDREAGQIAPKKKPAPSQQNRKGDLLSQIDLAANYFAATAANDI